MFSGKTFHLAAKYDNCDDDNDDDDDDADDDAAAANDDHHTKCELEFPLSNK